MPLKGLKFFVLIVSFIYTTDTLCQQGTILVNSNQILAGDTVDGCASLPINFDVNHSILGTNISYSWSFIGGSPSSSAIKNPLVSFSSTGIKSIVVNVYGLDTVAIQIYANIYPQVVPGSLNGNQTICNGVFPNAITRQNATGGNGVFSYEWQYSIGNTLNWVNTGQSGLSYTPSFPLTMDTWFRVKVIANCGIYFSSNAKVTVLTPIVVGFINGLDSVCTTQNLNLSISPALGGFGIFSYVWEQRPIGNTTWQVVPGSGNSTFLTISNLNQNTDFRVRVLNCGADVFSPIHFVKLKTPASATILGLLQDTICFSEPFPLLSISSPVGVTNYVWFRKFSNNQSWTNVGYSSTFQSPNLFSGNWQFYAIGYGPGSTSTCPAIITDTILVHFLANTFPPTINSATANQVICPNTQPNPLVRTQAQGGSNSFTYQWQDSIAGVIGWNNTGISTLSYQPGPLSSERWIRVVAIDNHCSDTLFSPLAHISFHQPVQPGVIQPDTVGSCNGNPIFISISGTVAGSTSHTQLWQYKPLGALTWASYSGATGNAITVQNLPPHTYLFRVRFINSCGQIDSSNTAVVQIAAPLQSGQITTSTGQFEACIGQSSPTLRLANYGGGLGDFDFYWERKFGNGSWVAIGTNADSLVDNFIITQPTLYRVSLTNQGGCGSINALPITINPGVPLSASTSIIGEKNVCQGQQNAYYRIDPIYTDSVHWQLSSGNVVNNGSDRIFINYFANFSNNVDTLYAYLKNPKNGCLEVLKFTLDIGQNFTPAPAAITYLPNSNTLVYADSLSGFSIIWGTIERTSGVESILTFNSGYKFTLPAPMDTLVYLYFAIISNSACSTRVIFNGTSQPFNLDDFDVNKGFSIYPNPNQGRIFLIGDKKDIITLRILDMLGTVTTIDVSQTDEEIILPSSLSSGKYILEIVTKHDVQRISFILTN